MLCGKQEANQVFQAFYLIFYLRQMGPCKRRSHSPWTIGATPIVLDTLGTAGKVFGAFQFAFAARVAS